MRAARDTSASAGRLDSLKRRHQLLRTAQSILYSEKPIQIGRRCFGGEPKKQHRTVWCHRHVTHDGGMPVHRKLDGTGARLSKIKTCGSVWACPVCSAKVAEVRRRELVHAMVKHTEVGGHAYLLTFTFPHYVGQTLAELMVPFADARQRFQNCKSWKAVMKRAAKEGVVNSLEVTYGAGNGWHPHLHMLVFCAPGAFAEGLPDDAGRLGSAAIDHLRAEWVRLLEKCGLVDVQNRQWASQYGLDVRGGKAAAEYIAKWGHDHSWGMSSELTSAHAKIGKRDTWGGRDHYTPFQLLAMAKAGDGHAICAFREFVGEFDGRRMLTWSKGLKAHFGIADMDDDQAAEQEALALPDEHCIGELQPEQLQTLTRYGALGDFLAFAAEFGYQEQPQQLLDDWIAAVARAGPARRGGAILIDRLVITDHSYFHRPELVE